jgi:DNA-binding TFAR19-related protein (PDSD5 family)
MSPSRPPSQPLALQTNWPLTQFLNKPAVERLDHRFLQFPVFFQQGECFLFIAAHQGRISDNIREHDGRELTGL